MIEPEVVADLTRTFSAALSYEDPAKNRSELLAAGWLDLLEADEVMAAAIVFRIQGENCIDAAALDDVISHRMSGYWSDATAGDLTVAYPLSPGGRAQPIHAVFPAHSQGTRVLWIGEANTGGLEIIELEKQLHVSKIDGVDADGGFLKVLERPAGRSMLWDDPQASLHWGDVLARARTAVAFQMVAGSRTLLTMAVEYAQAREQFGTPIGAFQAVKHRLAEVLVAVTSAEAAVVSAATTGSTNSAALAKSLAGRAAATAARNCLQVFGGIGFTTEHQFHRYMRRNLVLDRLLGDTRSLDRELGQKLRAGEFKGERIVNLEDPFRLELFA